MNIKEELLAVVRAFNTLLSNQMNADALKKAQDDLAELKAADQLSDSEQAEVDQALAKAAAAKPPTPQDVQSVQSQVDQTNTTGSAMSTQDGQNGQTGATGVEGQIDGANTEPMGASGVLGK